MDFEVTSGSRVAIPGGRMPPSTAARMVAATHVLTTVNTYSHTAAVRFRELLSGGARRTGCGRRLRTYAYVFRLTPIFGLRFLAAGIDWAA